MSLIFKKVTNHRNWGQKRAETKKYPKPAQKSQSRSLLVCDIPLVNHKLFPRTRGFITKYYLIVLKPVHSKTTEIREVSNMFDNKTKYTKNTIHQPPYTSDLTPTRIFQLGGAPFQSTKDTITK